MGNGVGVVHVLHGVVGGRVVDVVDVDVVVVVVVDVDVDVVVGAAVPLFIK